MAIEIIEIDLKQIDTPRNARVTLAQTHVLEPTKICPDSYLDSVGKAEKNKLIEIQSERIRKQLKRALLDEPNFVLFPELSIPWEMQDELREVAIKEKVYIIGGLTYGPDYQNTCAVFPPFKSDKIPFQYKLNRAPAENINVKTGQRVLIFKNSGFGTFACVICYDFTSLRIGREIRDHGVHILFLPILNRAVDLFDNMATGQCYTMYTYICLCNSAGSGLGNSASYGPVRTIEGGQLQQERVIGKIAGTQETTLTTVLDTPGLLESIQRFKNNRVILTGFITPPADLREPGVLISPFTPLGPARENFVGRDLQMREFWALIESSNHVLILGPSGTGKTSFIRRVRAKTPMELRSGFIEVYDTEGTFDFFRRLSLEIISRAETAKQSIRFKSTLQAALDDIEKTRDAVARYGFEESSKAFIEAFHNLAQAIDVQTVGKVVIFIDQAERLACLEEDYAKQRYAIRILINIMRDLESLRAPVLFALAVRQHDYDPLIALASNHIPARIVALQKFSRDEAVLAVEKPLPPEVAIDRAVSSQIAEISRGSPFFVQLLADATFKKLGQRKLINSEVFEELNIRDQRDVFPILMTALTPNEQRFVEAMGMCREYIVKMEDIIDDLNIEPQEFRHVADLLLGKNVIESLENDRFRFVHDQMKGFIQREWLAAKMSNREKLRTETQTALQMLFLSPDDKTTVSFSLPLVSMCCFKSLFLDDIDNLSRVLEQVASLEHARAADLCLAVLAAGFRCVSRSVFNNLRSKLALLLEKNRFYTQTSLMLAIEIINGETPDSKSAQRAIDLQEKLAIEYSREQKERLWLALGHYMQAATWAMAVGDFSRKDHLFKKSLTQIHEMLERGGRKWLYWPWIERGSVRGYTECNLPQFMHAATEWAGKMGHFQEQNKFLKRALKLGVGNANREKKEGEFFKASSSYAETADWAEEIGDDKLQVELYGKAIELRLRYPEEVEKVVDYDEASDNYAEAANWAEKIGDEKSRRELYTKAIDLQLREAERNEKKEEYCTASDNYAKAANWAEEIGDDKLRAQLYGKAIVLRLADATAKEKRGNLSSVSADYIQAAKWANTIGGKANRDALYGKATRNLRRAAETYERLASFLLNEDTLVAASALRDYFSKVEEKYAYFDRILSIVKECRASFESV